MSIGKIALAVGAGSVIGAAVTKLVGGGDDGVSRNDGAPAPKQPAPPKQPSIGDAAGKHRIDGDAIRQANAGYTGLDFMAMVGELHKMPTFMPHVTEVAARMGVPQTSTGGLAAGALFTSLDSNGDRFVTNDELIPFARVLTDVSTRDEIAQMESLDPTPTPGTRTETSPLASAAEQDLQPLSPEERYDAIGAGIAQSNGELATVWGRDAWVPTAEMLGISLNADGTLDPELALSKVDTNGDRAISDTELADAEDSMYRAAMLTDESPYGPPVPGVNAGDVLSGD